MFSLKNLSCSYSRNVNDKVLHIQDLTLHRNKIIFLLGASGSGKSTLLETLGLMNNTIAEGQLLFQQGNTVADISKLWATNNISEITRIRKSCMSFIFQNTNLMENFTAYENICLSQMVKNDTALGPAMKGAKQLMQQVGLSEEQVNEQTLSVNLSGGQRQRVSFVRALNNSFEVLLCDEPTGNLDEANAHELLSIIKSNLHGERTAIIVSHDVNLALKYADQIVVITKNEKENYGEVLQENIFERSQWEILKDSKLFEFRSLLINFFDSKKQQVAGTPLSIQRKEVSNNSNLRQLFLRKESKSLIGKGYRNLLILISIIGITLFAIGFANGALSYLSKKLNDKFVNWLVVQLPSTKTSAALVDDYLEILNDSLTKNELGINVVTGYKRLGAPFFMKDSSEFEFVAGRLIAYDDSLLTEFLSKDNQSEKFNKHYTFQSEFDFGVILTEKILERLGYTPKDDFIYFNNSETDTLNGETVHYKIPIPIRAVVKDLPGKNNFLMTYHFFNVWTNSDDKTPVLKYFEAQRKNIILLLDSNKNEASELCTALKKSNVNRIIMDSSAKLVRGYTEEEIKTLMDAEGWTREEVVGNDTVMQFEISADSISIGFNVEKNNLKNYPCYAVAVSFDSKPNNFRTTENVYRKIINLPIYKQYKDKITRVIDFDLAQPKEDKTERNYLSINLTEGGKGLDKIDTISKFIVSVLNSGNEAEQSSLIELDAGAIKEKKNFRYMANITYLITVLLIIFCILSINLFISNLLKSHLEKVKMNMGTFKAFGLSDKDSTNIYLTIMVRFIFIAILVAIVLALLLGAIFSLAIDKSGYGINEYGVEYFKLLQWSTLFVIVILIFVSIYISYTNINKILSKTPGDLIYNR